MCQSDPTVHLGDEANKIMQAFTANYPAMAKVIGQQMTPLSQATLDATKATYPATQELGLQTDLNATKGTGQQLLDSAINLEKETNPEFYAAKAETGGAVDSLMKSVDLSGNLSGGETAAIERANNRANINQGISTPTPTSAVSNAMQFGEAANTRKLQQQGILTGAIGAANAFLPASQTNIDPFQIATGRSSSPATAPGAAMSASLGSGTQSNIAGIEPSAIQANANRQSGFEKFMQSMPSYSG